MMNDESLRKPSAPSSYDSHLLLGMCDGPEADSMTAAVSERSSHGPASVGGGVQEPTDPKRKTLKCNLKY